MAGGLSIPILTRTWQMLLKGTEEVRVSPNPISALEMIIVRLTYSANLPTPEELVKEIRNNSQPTSGTAGQSSTKGGLTSQASATITDGTPDTGGAPQAFNVIQGSGQSAVRLSDPAPETNEEFIMSPSSFEQLVALFETKGKPDIAFHLNDNVRLVSFDQGRIDIRTNDRVPKTMTGRMAGLLKQWTGQNWVISLSSEFGEDTLYEKEKAEQAALKEMVMENELIKSILGTFAGASLSDIRKIKDDFIIETNNFDAEFLISADEFGLEED
jgi:DNA polymerase-3 subunit gamma/tau